MDIVEEIRKDRENGAKRLVSEYKNGLLTLARRFCSDMSDAEELVNRTFAEVLANVDRYVEQSAFFGWMCQILSNLHANDCRRKSNANTVYPGDVPDVADWSAQEAIFSGLDHESLRDAIEQLPKDIRKAVILHYFEEMPVREVARILSTPTGTIAWRLHCAREILAAKLSAGAKKAVSKSGAKALLIALALVAVAAVGAVGVVAIRSAAEPEAEESEVVFNAKSTENTEGSLEVFEGLSEECLSSGADPTNHETNGDSPQQSEAIIGNSNTNTEENAMNTKLVKSAAVKALALGAMLMSTPVQAADYYVAKTGSDDDDGSAEHPFATISNAIEKADAAIAGGAQHVIINAADGSYPENGLVVTNAIVIAGNAADRTAVKIGKSGARVFRIAHADAALKNLTVQNGTVTTSAAANAGGNVRLENGTVANCVLKGGGKASLTDYKGGNLYISAGSAVDCLMTSPLSGPGMFGANAYIAGGVVSRCILENAPKTSSWTSLGSGAYLTGGVIENCLLRGNYAGRGTLYLNSSAAKAVNCTIVGNVPETFSGGGIAGVYVNSTAASVINCVIFDNGGTATSEWGNNNGARFFNCVSTVDNANGVNWTTLPFTTKSSYFEDDEFWTPLLGTPMVDGGDDSRYPSTSSQTDIAGNARVSGSHIDIGCSELDQSSFNVTAAVASYPSVLKGATVDFVCYAAGATDVVTYELDFGDGSAHLVTTDSRISRRFDVAGLFYTRIRGRDGSGEYGDWVDVSVAIRVAEADIYVSTEGNDANAGTAAAPFRTITHALATLTNVSSSCATDVDGVTVRIAAGTYEENGLPAIGSRVTVEGIASDRNAVKVGKTGARIFCLTDEDAVLRNLTVTNGTVTAADISYAGGNVRLESGMVTNCVLTGGGNTSVNQEKGGNLYIASGKAVDCLMTNARPGRGAMGANAYMTGGCVSRCIIENTPAPPVYTAEGAGAYMTGGVIENCLLRNNNAGRGAICMNGACQAVNCTVVSNIPLMLSNQGGIGGIYVMNASASVVNCVVYNNGGTALAEWANKNAARFYSCAFAAAAAYSGTASTVLNLTDAAFKDAANGNYRPKSNGALFNAGDNERYSSYATSLTDLDGGKRIQGRIIDIGCYEASAGIGSVYYIR